MTVLVNGNASPWDVAIICNRGCGAVLTESVDAETRVKAARAIGVTARRAGWRTPVASVVVDDWCPACVAAGRAS